LVHSSGLSYAIVRPTLVFGRDDILVNNMAWGLRHVRVFLVPGQGTYQVQPVSVAETASICVDAGSEGEDLAVDAAGPVRWTFEQFVRLIGAAVGSRAWITRTPVRVPLGVAQVRGLLLRDVLLPRDELGPLMAGLLVSDEPARGRERFDTWVS